MGATQLAALARLSHALSAPAVTPTPLPTVGIQAVGDEKVLISEATRESLGIAIGPDSQVAQLPIGDGSTQWLFFTAEITSNVQPGGKTFRFLANRDFTGLTQDPSPMAVLLPDRVSAIPSTPDYDYAGGGTVIQCPDGGKLLYFYHGENQTDTCGSEAHHTGFVGWSGTSMAYWDQGASAFVKDGEIVGLNLTNQWFDCRGSPTNPQGAPLSGQGAVMYNGADGYLYLYSTDETSDPEYAWTRQYLCGSVFSGGSGSCTAVARAPLTEVCANAGTGTATPWLKYYHGSFSEPGLNADGTGGKFTPLYVTDSNGGDRSILPYAQVTVQKFDDVWVLVEMWSDSALRARTSYDGLNWSDGMVVVAPPPTPAAYDQAYPYLYSNTATGNIGLTYTHFRLTPDYNTDWSSAELHGQDLRILPMPRSETGVADFVFLVDTSPSMRRDVTTGLPPYLGAFPDRLTAAGVDWRMALVRFGTGSDGNGPDHPEVKLDWTADRASFLAAAVDLRNHIYGSTKSGTEAINLALDRLVFRPNAQRVFVLFTDGNDDLPLSIERTIKRKPPGNWTRSSRQPQFQARLDATAQRLIGNHVELNLVVRPSSRPTEFQYGSPRATQLDATGRLDIGATLALLVGAGQGQSLQGQLLAAASCIGGICSEGRLGLACTADADCALPARAFDIRLGRKRKTSATFYADLFAELMAQVSRR